MLWLSLAALMMLSTGCKTASSDPKHTGTTTLRCPPVVDYPKNTQRQAAEELKKLPPGSKLPSMVTDYSRMRDACRAINGSRR